MNKIGQWGAFDGDHITYSNILYISLYHTIYWIEPMLGLFDFYYNI